jgi:hypothetical protein
MNHSIERAYWSNKKHEPVEGTIKVVKMTQKGL